MIVKKLPILMLCVNLMEVVSSASISNVFVERETSPARYNPYTYASIASPQFSQIKTFPVPVSYADPCGSPCVIPGQPLAALRPSANIISYKSPYPTLPIVIGAPNEESNSYQYSYMVYDENTGDHKTQRELSDGSVVRGEYSLIQPDGFVRKVQYVADDLKGFNAVVKNYIPAILGNNRKVGISHQNEPCHDVKKESRSHKSKHFKNDLHVPGHISEKILDSTHIHSSRLEQKQNSETVRGNKPKVIHEKHEYGYSHETGHDLQTMNSNAPSHSHEHVHVNSAEHNHKSEDTHHLEHSQQSGYKLESHHDYKLDNNQKLVLKQSTEDSHKLDHGHDEHRHLPDNTSEHSHEHSRFEKNSHELDKNHDRNHKLGHDDVSRSSHEISNQKISSVSDGRAIHDHDMRMTHDPKIHDEHIKEVHNNAFMNIHNGEMNLNRKHTKNSKSNSDSEEDSEDSFRDNHGEKSHNHSKQKFEHESHEHQNRRHDMEHEKSSSEESYHKSTQKHKKQSKSEYADDNAFDNSNEKHRKKLKQRHEERSSEESEEELVEMYHKNSKNNRNHHKKQKDMSESRESDSEEHFRGTLFHNIHKQSHDLVKPKQEVVVSYHDVVRCLQNAVRKSYGGPGAALREDPSYAPCF